MVLLAGTALWALAAVYSVAGEKGPTFGLHRLLSEKVTDKWSLGWTGVRLKEEKSLISMGKNDEVQIARVGDGNMDISAKTVKVNGALEVDSLKVVGDTSSQSSVDQEVTFNKPVNFQSSVVHRSGVIKQGIVWQGSIPTAPGKWWPMIRIKKGKAAGKDGGYNVHKFRMTVSSSENSAFALFNMHGYWQDRSDHSSGHGDFSGFSVSSAGNTGDNTHEHSSDVSFKLSNCGVTNGDMYLLAAKVTYSTGRNLQIHDLYYPPVGDVWEYAPFAVDKIPEGCQKLAPPTERSGVSFNGPVNFGITPVFKSGWKSTGYLYAGNLDDEGKRGQWWALARIKKAKDDGYNSHFFSMTVQTMHNNAIDIFKLSGHWSDRSDHSSGHGDFGGFTAARQGDCTYGHACDVAFMMSTCGVTNGDLYILVAKAIPSQNTGKQVAVLDLYHRGKDQITFGPHSGKDMPAGCKKLAPPAAPTGNTVTASDILDSKGTLELNGFAALNKGGRLKGQFVFEKPPVTHGTIWSGSIGASNGNWWAMARLPKLKNGGYHVHRYILKVATSENSGFSVYNLHGFWIDRSDHSSGHGDFSGFSVSNAGRAGECLHTHSCDVAFAMTNCGVSNGPMYILAGKISYNTGRSLQVLDLWYPQNTDGIWEWAPSNVPSACSKYGGGPKTRAGNARRLEDEASEMETLRMQIRDEKLKNDQQRMKHAKEIETLKSKLDSLEARLDALHKTA